jgi:orotate phosphoribosyltransferase
MDFRSMTDMNRDLAQWSDDLPRDIDVVAGIPRSGLLAAAMLALHLQLPLTDVRGLTQGRLLGGGARLGSLDEGAYLASARRVLVLDDSVYTGRAIAEARAAIAPAVLDGRVRGEVEYAAVYASPRSTGKVDRHFTVLPQPRAFEWNVMHHPCLSDSCMDIDGVLCRDPRADENDDGARYAVFLRDVSPRLVPSVEVGHLVTSRLERYRPETEAWLSRVGIRYRQLHMHPAATGAERRALGDHAQFKASVCRKVGAPLFVESELSQALVIAEAAAVPVYCTDARRMVYPGGGDDVPRPGQALRWQMRHELRMRAAQARRRLSW